MKNFTEFINEANLEVQDNTIGYVSAEDLKKYLKITTKFISQEAKDIINWLITNESSYMEMLGHTSTEPNPIVHFYNAGVPKDKALKELYKNIGVLNKKNRIIELPNLMTKDQFEGILDKTIAPDEVLLDLSTPKGQNDVAKQFMPLVHKIAHTRFGKTRLSYEELVAAGQEGLTWAILQYGKKSPTLLKKEEMEGITRDITERKTMTFFTFAACRIFTAITEAEKNESHTVRIPISRQKREKKENGRMIRQNTVSGEEKQSSSSGEGDGKSIFDKIGVDSHDAAYRLDQEDLDKLWKGVKKKLLDHFDQKTIDIFCSFLGLWDYEKMKNKDIAKKYGCVPGNITAIKNKVIKYINTDKELKQDFQDIWELVKECIHDRDAAENDDIYIISDNSYLNNDNNDNSLDD